MPQANQRSFLSTVPQRLAAWSRRVARELHSRLVALGRYIKRQLIAVWRVFLETLEAIRDYWVRFENALIPPLADFVLAIWALRQFLMLLGVGIVLPLLAVRYPVLWLVAIPYAVLFLWAVAAAFRGKQSADEIDDSLAGWKRPLVTGLRVALRVALLGLSLVVSYRIYQHVRMPADSYAPRLLTDSIPNTVAPVPMNSQVTDSTRAIFPASSPFPPQEQLSEDNRLPLPPGMDRVTPGMRLSQAKRLYPGGHMGPGYYTVRLEHGLFTVVTYHSYEAETDPVIDLVTFRLRDRESRRLFLSALLRELAAFPVRTAGPGGRTLWPDVHGFEASVDDLAFYVSRKSR